MALLSGVTNAAASIGGTAALTSATPRSLSAIDELASSASVHRRPLPPWPDDGLDYSALPATGDDGFPQAFLLELQGVVYRLTLAVYCADPDFVVTPRIREKRSSTCPTQRAASTSISRSNTKNSKRQLA